MRNTLFIVSVAVLVASCGAKDDKTKENQTTTEQAVPGTDTAVVQNDSTGKQPDSKTKTLKLTFNGYEEGDYAHLLFKDVTTGEEYDFGHPDENGLGDIPLVQKSDKASFGYIQNSQLTGEQFMVTIARKMTDTYDESGQPVKAERWRIIHMSSKR